MAHHNLQPPRTSTTCAGPWGVGLGRGPSLVGPGIAEVEELLVIPANTAILGRSPCTFPIIVAVTQGFPIWRPATWTAELPEALTSVLTASASALLACLAFAVPG